MFTDHFDGKSIKSKSDAWLRAAIDDAQRKSKDCATPQESDGRTFPAHVAMWEALAAKYKAEMQRRGDS